MKIDKHSAAFMGIGFELLAVTVGSLFIGQKIDQAYNFKGLATGGLVFCALVGWTYHFIILIRNYEREKKREKEENEKQSH